MHRPALTLLASVLLFGCASQEMIEGRGLDDFGRRYAWVKAGASELDRRRDIVTCAQAGQRRLTELLTVSAVPVLGLMALPGTLPEEQAILEGRVTCMQDRGWQLVDVSTGQPQAVAFSLGFARLTPR